MDGSQEVRFQQHTCKTTFSQIKCIWMGKSRPPLAEIYGKKKKSVFKLFERGLTLFSGCRVQNQGRRVEWQPTFRKNFPSELSDNGKSWGMARERDPCPREGVGFGPFRGPLQLWDWISLRDCPLPISPASSHTILLPATDRLVTQSLFLA